MKPANTQIELVRGCNLKCDFCAIHNVPKEKQFMDFETYMNALTGLAPFDPLRIEFAMRGEPTLHPQLIDYTALARGLMPKSQITLTTNGILLTPELLNDFFHHGGNICIIDCYNGTFEKYKEKYKDFPLHDFYSEDNKINPWHRNSVKTKAVLLMKDISENTGKKTRVILNQAGNVDWKRVEKYGLKPLEKPLEKQCAHPFREIAIFVDGSISICCRDWKLENVLYNVNTHDIFKEFNENKELMKVRKLLQNKDRSKIPICSRCNFNGGFYLGFLPKV